MKIEFDIMNYLERRFAAEIIECIQRNAVVTWSDFDSTAIKHITIELTEEKGEMKA